MHLKKNLTLQNQVWSIKAQWTKNNKIILRNNPKIFLAVLVQGGCCPGQKAKWGGQHLLQPHGLLLPLLPSLTFLWPRRWHAAPPSSASLLPLHISFPTPKLTLLTFAPSKECGKHMFWGVRGRKWRPREISSSLASRQHSSCHTTHRTPLKPEQIQTLNPHTHGHNHKLSSHALFSPSMHLATSLELTWFHAPGNTNWWQGTESQPPLAWANTPPSSSCLVCS